MNKKDIEKHIESVVRIAKLILKGYKHQSLIEYNPTHIKRLISYLPKYHINYEVNSRSSYKDLIHRCPECSGRKE